MGRLRLLKISKAFVDRLASGLLNPHCREVAPDCARYAAV